MSYDVITTAENKIYRYKTLKAYQNVSLNI